MNRVYKVIWSKAKQGYVVVSELAKTHSKSNAIKCAQTSATILLLVITFISGSGYVGINGIYAAGDSQWGGTVDGYGGVVIGPSSKGSGENTTVYGYYNTANGERTTVIGNNNHASKKDGGTAAGDIVSWATILGNNNRVRANDGIAIGDNVHTEGAAAIGIGLYTRATGAHSVAIGSSADDWNTNNTAVKSLGDYSVAIGTASISEGSHSIAFGYQNYAKRNNAISIGNENNAYGENGIAIGINTSSGNNSDSNVKDTIAVGNDSKATGNQSTALGKGSRAMGANAVAIGSNAQANEEQGVAIGMNAKTVANAVALGANAAATESNTVSVGTAGGTMSRLVNMANATDDHDAAAYNQLITNVQYKDGKIAFYKGKAGETATDPAKAAWSFDINGTALTTENKAPRDTTYTDGNIQINKTTLHGQNTYDVKLNNKLNLTEQGSLTAGNTKLDTTGLVITDGPKVTKAGIDAGNQVINNVTDGKISTNSKEAINGSQLYKVEQKSIKNEKDIANIKTGDFFDQKTITNVTNKLTDGGEIAKDNAHLVTGGTIYTEVRPTDGTYVKTSNTTAGNLNALDTQTKTNTDAIANIKTGDFFDNTTVTNITNKLTDGGEITKDNAHLVTGGTIYTEVRPTDGTYVKTANTTAGNLNALDTQTKTNTDAIANIKTGDFFDNTTVTNITNKLTDGGEITKDNAHLVTGGTIYTEVRPTDGTYVKTANTTAGNLNALDAQTKTNTDAIANIKTGDFFDNTTVTNITNKLTDGGEIAKDNAHLVTGGTIYTEVRPTDGTYVKTANTTAGNLNALDVQTKTNTDAIANIKTGDFFDNTTVTNITNKLTDGGEITKDNAHLVTGGTIYTEVRPTDGTYVKTSNTTAGNLNALDAQIKTNTDAIANNTDAIANNADSIASIKNGDFFDNTTITNITKKLTDGGEIVKDNAHLVTGGTIYTEVRPTDGTYVKTSNTTAGNLNALDVQTKTNTDAIANIKTGDFFDNTTVTNITNKLTDGGEITKDNAHLVTGGTIYTEVRPTDGTYVKTSNTTAGNLNALDAQTKTNTDAIANIKTGDFFDNTTVTNITNKLTDGGEIVKDNAHLVTGGTIYTEVRPTDGTYVKTSNTTAGNLNALDAQIKTNTDAIANNTNNIAKNADSIASIKNGDFFDNTTITNITKKLTDGGEIVKDNAHLVTGGTIYTEVRPTDGTYVKTSNTTAGNLNALDAQIKTNTDAIANNTNNIAKNADSIASIKNGDFFDNTTITNITKKLTDGGEIVKDNAHLVTGGTIYTEVRPTDGTYVKTDNTTAANLNALDRQIKNNTDAIANIQTGSFFDQTTVEKWTEKLDVGQIEAGNTGLVSGGKVYEKIGSLDDNAKYNYIKAANNLSENLVQLDTAIASGSMLNNETTVNNYIHKLSDGGKVEAGNTKLVTGGTVYEAMQRASFLDDEKAVQHFTNKLVNGAKVEKDNTKLVTGGMVHQAVQEEAAARENADMALAKGIHDIGRQIGNIDKRIHKVGAGAAALAALHTQAFDPNDKWDFAVGYGHYKNANAGALGAFYKPNANVIVSAASTFGNGDPMVNAGISVKIGAGGAKENAVVKQADYDVLQQKISRQEKQLALQEEQLKELRNLIETLTAKQ